MDCELMDFAGWLARNRRRTFSNRSNPLYHMTVNQDSVTVRFCESLGDTMLVKRYQGRHAARAARLAHFVESLPQSAIFFMPDVREGFENPVPFVRRMMQYDVPVIDARTPFDPDSWTEATERAMQALGVTDAYRRGYVRLYERTGNVGIDLRQNPDVMKRWIESAVHVYKRDDDSRTYKMLCVIVENFAVSIYAWFSYV